MSAENVSPAVGEAAFAIAEEESQGRVPATQLARAVFESIDTYQIQRVLARHVLSEPTGGTASAAECKCRCGETFIVLGNTRETVLGQARRHVADMIRQYLLTGEA